MLHLGDITKVNGGAIPPVHIITFGSPCRTYPILVNEKVLQEVNLVYLHAIRIIEEMKCNEWNISSYRCSGSVYFGLLFCYKVYRKNN